MTLRQQGLAICAVALFAAALAGCVSRRVVPSPGDPASWGVDIAWHGHSCFSFRDGQGHVVVVDPFDETVGYAALRLCADELLVTHDHFDHNNVRSVSPVDRQSLKVVDSTGTSQTGGLTFQGILADHDDQEGRAYGRTHIFIWTMGGLKFAHLGDLGQSKLTSSQKEALREVDVLFVPVGGFVTLGAQGAYSITQEIAPHAVFPIHYGRPEVRFYPLDRVDPFLNFFPPASIHRFQGSHLRLRKKDLESGMAIYVPQDPSNSNCP